MRLSMLRRGLYLASLAACLGLAAPAAAEEGGDARRYFEAAQKAFDEGRYVDAARAFEEAFRIKPHPAPLINAGDAWEKAGEYALAARIFERVLKLEQSGDQDRSDAIERLARLKPQLGVIELKGAADVRVKIDDEEFHGGDRVYVIPGEHKVTLVDVEGAKLRIVTAPSGSAVSVDVASLHPGQKAAGPAGAQKPGGAKATPGAVQHAGVATTTWVAYGLGAIGLGGAIFFGLQANSTADAYDAQPNQSDFDSFGTQKLLCNISLGVGVVGVALGTVLLVGDLGRTQAGPEAAAPTRSRLRRAPTLGFSRVDVVPTPGGGFVTALGTF